MLVGMKAETKDKIKAEWDNFNQQKLETGYHAEEGR